MENTCFYKNKLAKLMPIFVLADRELTNLFDRSFAAPELPADLRTGRRWRYSNNLAISSLE